MPTSVTGITIIALGTSLPDTFASRTAAQQDEYADAAIGNVTGKAYRGQDIPESAPFALMHLYITKLLADPYVLLS